MNLNLDLLTWRQRFALTCLNLGIKIQKQQCTFYSAPLLVGVTTHLPICIQNNSDQSGRGLNKAHSSVNRTHCYKVPVWQCVVILRATVLGDGSCSAVRWNTFIDYLLENGLLFSDKWSSEESLMRVNKIDVFDTFDPEIDLFNAHRQYCNWNVLLTVVHFTCLSYVTVLVGHFKKRIGH
jgi:hypothetical protein